MPSRYGRNLLNSLKQASYNEGHGELMRFGPVSGGGSVHSTFDVCLWVAGFYSIKLACWSDADLDKVPLLFS